MSNPPSEDADLCRSSISSPIHGTTSGGDERTGKKFVEGGVADQRRSTRMRGDGSISSNASSRNKSTQSSRSSGSDEDSSSAATMSDTTADNEDDDDDEDENDDIGDEELEQARKAIEEYKKQRAEAKSASAQGSGKGSKELIRRERRQAMESNEIIKTSNTPAYNASVTLPSTSAKKGDSPSVYSGGEEQPGGATSFFHSLAGLIPPCQKISQQHQQAGMSLSESHQSHQFDYAVCPPSYKAAVAAVRPFALRSVYSVTNVTSALPTSSIATYKGPNAVHCSNLSGDLVSSGSNKKTGCGSSRINSTTATTIGLSALPSFSLPFVNSGGKRFVEAPSRSVGGDGASGLLVMPFVEQGNSTSGAPNAGMSNHGDGLRLNGSNNNNNNTLDMDTASASVTTSSLDADLTQMRFQYFRNDDPLLLNSLLSNAVLFHKLVSSVRKFSKAAEAADKESAVANTLQSTINRSSIVDRVIHNALTETMMITKPSDHGIRLSGRQGPSPSSAEAEAHKQPDGEQAVIQSRTPSSVYSFLCARPLFSAVASCYLAPPPARSDKEQGQDNKNKRNIDQGKDGGCDNSNKEQASLAVSLASTFSSSSAARGPSHPYSVASANNKLRYAYISRDRVVGRKRTARDEGVDMRYDLNGSMTNNLFYEDDDDDDDSDGEEKDRKQRTTKAVDRAPNREVGGKGANSESCDMERRKIIFEDFLRDDINDKGRDDKVRVDENNSLSPSDNSSFVSKETSELSRTDNTFDNLSGRRLAFGDVSSSASLATDVGIVSAIAASVTINGSMCGTRPAETANAPVRGLAKSSNTTPQGTQSANPTASGGGGASTTVNANAIGTFLEKGDFVAKAQWAEYQHELLVERKNKEAAERAAQRRAKSNRR